MIPRKPWAIKNSWPGWGTQGFGYIGYTANNIGYGAAYVVPAIAATGPMASAAPAAPTVGAAPATRNITPRTSALRTIAPPRFFPAPEPPAVGAPPVPAADPGHAAGSRDEGPGPETTILYTDVSCPEKVWLKTPRFPLVLRLTRKPRLGSRVNEALNVEEGQPVRARLAPTPFFELLEPKVTIQDDRNRP